MRFFRTQEQLDDMNSGPRSAALVDAQMRSLTGRDPLAEEIDRLVECYECQGGGLDCVRKCFLANKVLQRRHGSGFCLSCGERTTLEVCVDCWAKGARV